MEKKAIKKHDCDHFCTLSLQGAQPVLVWRMFKLRHENTQDLLEAKHKNSEPSATIYVLYAALRDAETILYSSLHFGHNLNKATRQNFAKHLYFKVFFQGN